MITESTLSGIISELSFSTTRSGGAGGQHVNKVSSKVILEFNIGASGFLSLLEKEILLRKLSGKINKLGILQVVCQEDRSQFRNKDTAIKKFVALIRLAFTERKKRRPTKATKASKERRITSKKRRSVIKKNRGGRIED